MNYLKKKIKGHKKGHDSDDYDYYDPNAAPEGTRDEGQKDSEEWKFFQQLTQRVQDTVEKTQTTLNKLKDTSAVVDLNKPDYYSDSEENDNIPVHSSSWVNFEDQTGHLTSPTLEGAPKASKCVGPPPRPPPPKGKEESELIPIDEPEFHQALETEPCQTLNTDVSLLEEFGFQKDVSAVPTSNNFLLISENGEEDDNDPFDTSFVTQSILPQKPVEQLVSDIPENIFEEEPDPFDTSFVTDFKTGHSGLQQEKTDLQVEGKTSLILSPKSSSDQILEDMSNPFLTNTEDPLDLGGGLLNFSRNATNEPAKQAKAKTNPFSDFETPDVSKPSNLLDSVFGDPISVSDDHPLQESVSFSSNSDVVMNTSAAESLPTDLFGNFSEENTSTADPFNAFSSQPKTENLIDAFGDAQTKYPDTVDPFKEHEIEEEQNVFKNQAYMFDDNITDSTMKRNSLDMADSCVFETTQSNTADENIEVQEQRSKENSIETFIEFAQKNIDSCNFSEKNMDLFQPNAEKRHSLDFVKSDDESFVYESAIHESEDALNAPTEFQDKVRSPPVDVECTTVKEENVNQDLFDMSFNDNKVTEGIAPAMDPFDPFSTLETKPDNATVNDGWTVNAFNNSDKDAFGSDNFSESTSNITETVRHDSDQIAGGDLFFGHTIEKNLFDADDPFNSGSVQTVFEKTTELAFNDPFSSVTEQQSEVTKNAVPHTEKAAFEAFAAKFEQAIEKFEDSTVDDDTSLDPFAAPILPGEHQKTSEPFSGFDMFDPFAEVTKPPENTPIKKSLLGQASEDSFDEDDELDFSVVIKPKMKDASEINLGNLEPPPLLPPPPKSPMKAFAQQPTPVSRFNPFNMPTAVIPEMKPEELPELELPPALGEAGVKKTESQESPSTPLFDEDTSQPLEEFSEKFQGEGWEMMLRQPSKKKITGNRYWKKVFLRLSENSVLQLFNKKEDSDPFQELPLQACYSFSEIGAQQYDAYGKIFTVKLNYIFYRERVGVRPGQLSKVMQGQITSVGQIAKLGLPLEHAPQVSQLLKLGTQTYEDLKSFVQVLEDALFHLVVHRDRALTYKTEEVQVTVHDELYVEQRKDGHVEKQKARVRLFFLAFISGMPDVEVGLNDMIRQGKEVVGRYDIIPVVTEEWIRLENCEFHCCVMQDEFEKKRIVKLHPPDACLFELMRFRIRPPKNRELPLQIKVNMKITSMRVEIRADVLVPGYHSRKHGQVPCEDIKIRFPVPECWIYLFRVEKHFRYGSLKSAARRPGKIKGLERIMGTAQNLDPSLIEVSAGQAKYEHAFKAIVWRIPRLPKEGQGAYTTQLFMVKLDLTSFDQIPESFSQYVDVEFTMPATTVSHTTVRSISLTNSNPPEKYVKYLAKHAYKVQIDFSNNSEAEYTLATANATVEANHVQATIEEGDKHDDSNDSD